MPFWVGIRRQLRWRRTNSPSLARSISVSVVVFDCSVGRAGAGGRSKRRFAKVVCARARCKGRSTDATRRGGLGVDMKEISLGIISFSPALRRLRIYLCLRVPGPGKCTVSLGEFCPRFHINTHPLIPPRFSEHNMAISKTMRQRSRTTVQR